ncbi:Cof-type HAD-IIB family hydrolase [Entomohabitans teleogrylli]|uniref:Cof-type HAD-IIB family hydrolase n=1 Tax=Entomohabitans teleogrylli TaxID=1384589 RepID=UPI00073D4057|nr:Cof-type HAD-IIB family hydrolase [Entomohabitans teleogrylli]
MSLKMVVTDLDGTLLTSQDTLTRASVDAFNVLQQQGILAVVATGRMYREARFAAEAIGATRYFVGMNGAQTLDLHSGEQLYDQALDAATVRFISQLLDELGVFYQIYTRDRVHVRRHWLDNIGASGMKEEYLRRFADQLQPFSDPGELPAVKMFILCRDQSQRQRIRDALAPLPAVSLVASHHHYFEVLPRGLNKGVALQHLCAHLGIAPGEVAAIGDSDNDIELLSTAGVGIAMGNAFTRLRQIADHIVPSNDEDGVAYALTEIIPQYL